MQNKPRFNVRVYGILVQDGKVLVSDESIKGYLITKFPGGGLEFGEGTIECVIREFKEETGLDIAVEEHFYTTDFFVESAFAKQNQVISIYYKVKPLTPFNLKISQQKFDFDTSLTTDQQSFRWIQLSELSENDLTFVIDKKVAEMLSRNYK